MIWARVRVMLLEKMDELILKICALRKYRAHETTAGMYVACDGTLVYFYFVDVFAQDFLNMLDLEHHLIILCNKQKKLRVPLEILSNIEIFIIETLRRQLIANKFCPRFELLIDSELETMKQHHKQLPILLTSDPMAQIYGFRDGQIVKIYRLDGSIYFRRVITG